MNWDHLYCEIVSAMGQNSDELYLHELHHAYHETYVHSNVTFMPSNPKPLSGVSYGIIKLECIIFQLSVLFLLHPSSFCALKYVF